jgi:hypothetical protein
MRHLLVRNVFLSLQIHMVHYQQLQHRQRRSIRQLVKAHRFWQLQPQLMRESCHISGPKMELQLQVRRRTLTTSTQ